MRMAARGGANPAPFRGAGVWALLSGSLRADSLHAPPPFHKPFELEYAGGLPRDRRKVRMFSRCGGVRGKSQMGKRRRRLEGRCHERRVRRRVVNWARAHSPELAKRDGGGVRARFL